MSLLSKDLRLKVLAFGSATGRWCGVASLYLDWKIVSTRTVNPPHLWKFQNLYGPSPPATQLSACSSAEWRATPFGFPVLSRVMNNALRPAATPPFAPTPASSSDASVPGGGAQPAQAAAEVCQKCPMLPEELSNA